MRTFLAFKLEDNFSTKEINAGIKRVLRHYYETLPMNFEVEEHVVIHKNIGTVIFDSKTTPLKWKSVVTKDNKSLITFNPPPNWHNFSTSKNIEEAPYEVMDRLLRDPNAQEEFSTPTLLSIIDKDNDTLSIYTDPLGFSRLYEYRGKNGWYWSNRPGATTLMANEEAKIDLEAWKFMATSGWFIDTTSPIKNVTRVKPGVRVLVDQDNNSTRRIIDNGSYTKLVSPRQRSKYNSNEIAHDMLENLASYADLWKLDFVVDLSGGKDSRLCAAAVIASGNRNITFSTIGIYDKEVEVASDLLEKVNLSHKHTIHIPSTRKSNAEKIVNSEKVIKTPIPDRMKFIFHETDGDVAPILTRKNMKPSNYFSDIRTIRIQGAMGEIGKAVYYGEPFYSRLVNMDYGVIENRLINAHKLFGGLKSTTADRGASYITKVLTDGTSLGIDGLSLFDYFYINDRVRRWLPQSTIYSSYSAFYSNIFFEQSFSMTHEDKMSLNIYNDIISELVPQWTNIPYYKRKLTERDERTEKGLRTWQTSDKEDIDEILKDPDTWNDIFDEVEVKTIWENTLKGNFHPATENLFDRLSMKASYQKHLDRLNSQISKEEPNKSERIIKSTFTPEKDISNLVDFSESRLVVFDESSSKFVIIEILEKDDEYTIPVELKSNPETLKYKYQIKNSEGKWKDCTTYTYISSNK